jgi:Pyruvate/2-oxoacid:ferredoxin oxidoreductase gamma subunit
MKAKTVFKKFLDRVGGTVVYNNTWLVYQELIYYPEEADPETEHVTDANYVLIDSEHETVCIYPDQEVAVDDRGWVTVTVDGVKHELVLYTLKQYKVKKK